MENNLQSVISPYNLLQAYVGEVVWSADSTICWWRCQSLGNGALGRYRCSGCRAFQVDRVVGLSGEKWISWVDKTAHLDQHPGGGPWGLRHHWKYHRVYGRPGVDIHKTVRYFVIIGPTGSWFNLQDYLSLVFNEAPQTLSSLLILSSSDITMTIVGIVKVIGRYPSL